MLRSIVRDVNLERTLQTITICNSYLYLYIYVSIPISVSLAIFVSILELYLYLQLYLSLCISSCICLSFCICPVYLCRGYLPRRTRLALVLPLLLPPLLVLPLLPTRLFRAALSLPPCVVNVASTVAVAVVVAVEQLFYLVFIFRVCSKFSWVAGVARGATKFAVANSTSSRNVEVDVDDDAAACVHSVHSVLN